MQKASGYYRIKNWHEYYENSQSKKYKNLSWVPIPNKHDGRKFREISTLDPSGGTFTAFILMVEIASKSENRGCLIDSEGHGLEPFDLQLMTGYPSQVFENAIKILSSSRIAWIEFVPVESDTSLPDSGSVLEDSGSIRNNCYATQNRTEQNRTEQNNSSEVRTPLPPKGRPEKHRTPPDADAEPNLKTESVKTAVAVAEPSPPPQRAQDVLQPPKLDDPDYDIKKEMHLMAKQLDASREDPESLKFEGRVLKIDHQTWQVWISNLGILPGQLAQACAILDAEMVPKRIRDPLAYTSRVLFQKSNDGSLMEWMRRCKPKNLDVSKFVKGQL